MINTCILQLELGDNELYRNLKLSVSDCPLCDSTPAEHLRAAAKSKSATSKEGKPVVVVHFKCQLSWAEEGSDHSEVFQVGVWL